jgi:hypothetical protein
MPDVPKESRAEGIPGGHLRHRNEYLRWPGSVTFKMTVVEVWLPFRRVWWNPWTWRRGVWLPLCVETFVRAGSDANQWTPLGGFTATVTYGLPGVGQVRVSPAAPTPEGSKL